MPPFLIRMTTDAHLVHDICDAHFASYPGPSAISRPRTGRFNDSWFFSLGDEQFVLRMAPDQDTGLLFYERNMLAQEPPLHQLIRARTDIPVAEIVFYDDTRSAAPRPFVVMRRLPGEPLTHAAGVDSDEVFRQVGAYLAQLHTLQAERYGYLGEHRPMAPAAAWTEAFAVMWGKLIDDIERCRGYQPDEARRMRGLQPAYAHVFERNVPATLLHMDLWHENILVDRRGRVTGIIDWDRALWGDVEIEFAVLDYCGVSVPSFWIGYGRQRDRNPEAQLRGVFYYLYELQKYIVIRRLRSHDPQAADRYRREALRIARQL